MNYNIGRIQGVKIFYSDRALEATDVRTFPKSKHRSKRIFKKLIKRFGTEFIMQPSIWQMKDGILAHPSFKYSIENMQYKEN